MTKAIMIQGTGSGVGKSVLVSALCRIFLQDGFSVSPFKAQNMALNSFVTISAKEIGRAQAVQAQASGKQPKVEMNPVLLKPKEDTVAQVIVLGKPLGDMTAQQYIGYKKRLLKTVVESYTKLKRENDIIVIEGAGSPAEINLKQHDIVNMEVAELFDVPVLLVVDIDKGGAFAWVVGTMELLSKKEKDRVKGIIINKFRGDRKILEPALNYLEKRIKKPVIGVVPFLRDIRIEEEDSIPEYRSNERKEINIAVISLPHIANFTDFDPLEREQGVAVHYIKDNVEGFDAIIIPGTKNTVADLIYLRKSGLAEKIKRKAKDTPVIGICGGFQMLGRKIVDSHKSESRYGTSSTLNLLNLTTRFEKEKITKQVRGSIVAGHLPFKCNSLEVYGYEIHMGRTNSKEEPLIEFQYRGRKRFDGAVSKSGLVWGTYFHGIFDNDKFRRRFVNFLRKRKGLNGLDTSFSMADAREKAFNDLARQVRKNLDVGRIYKIMGFK